jgi:hypothetical protein
MGIVRPVRRGSLSVQPQRRARITELPEYDDCIETNLFRYVILVSGDRKIGKTTFLREYPDPFFCFCEPGGVSVKAKKKNVRCWEDFQDLTALLEAKPDYCETVVIDTGYMLYEYCFDYCLRTFGIDKPQDEAWGNAWKFIEREFRTMQMKIIDSGFGLGVTAHTEIKTVKNRQGLEREKLTIQLGGQATKFYNAFADIIVHYQYNDDHNREMVIRGDDTIEAGTRTTDNFLYTDGSRIKSLQMEFTDVKRPEKAAFDLFVKAFNNELQKEGGSPAARVRKSR